MPGGMLFSPIPQSSNCLAANKTKGEIPKQRRYPKRQKVFFQRPMKKEVSESWIKLLGKKKTAVAHLKIIAANCG